MAYLGEKINREEWEESAEKGGLAEGDSAKLIRSHTSLRRMGGKEERTTKKLQRGVVRAMVR